MPNIQGIRIETERISGSGCKIQSAVNVNKPKIEMNLRRFSVFRGLVNSNQPLRTFASTSGGPVKLSFDRYENVKPEVASPLLILHGLFGSRQNWRGVSKRLNADLKRSVSFLTGPRRYIK